MDISLVDLMTSEGVNGDSMKLLKKKKLESEIARHPSTDFLFNLTKQSSTNTQDIETIFNLDVAYPPLRKRTQGMAVVIKNVIDVEVIRNGLILLLLVEVGAPLLQASLTTDKVSKWLLILGVSAVFTFLVSHRQSSLQSTDYDDDGKTSSGLSAGQPKVVKHVRDAKELLIKTIAKETSTLQRELLSQEVVDVNDSKGPGRRLLNLSQGVPCLPIFEASRDAMVTLLDKRRLPYSDVAGDIDVRSAAAKFVNVAYSQHGDRAFSAENVVVTSGAIQAIYNCLALCVGGPEDVVATPLPAYGLYKAQTELLRGTFVTFGAGQNSSLPTSRDIKELFAATNKTNDDVAGCRNTTTTTTRRQKKLRALVLVLPNNPTGAVLDANAARELCAALDEAWETWYADDPEDGFSVVLDEVYLGITAKPVVSLLHHASARLRNALFLVLSCSKGLGAMPGARAAWVTAPSPDLASQVAKVQLATTGNASTISQVGLKAALDHLRTNPRVLEGVWEYYSSRTALVSNRLRVMGEARKLGQVVAPGEPQATFYVWADFGRLPKVPGMSATDLELCAFLKNLVFGENDDDDSAKNCATTQAPLVGVAAVPGSAFGEAPGALRLRFSCACEVMSDLELAMGAVDHAVELICASDI